MNKVSKSTNFFTGRKLTIATMHQKERVIQPILEKELQVVCEVPENFNTDLFGTFSGEVKRTSTAIKTAREKCLAAMEITGSEMAVSSEGSFGSYPGIAFLPGNEELIFFMDKKNDIELFVREITHQTNFRGKTVSSENDLNDFIKSCGFPHHGVILKGEKKDQQIIKKGIVDLQELWKHFYALVDSDLQISVETDMRAMHNPTRMSTIENAAKKLVEVLKNNCPSCQKPGFQISEYLSGLPCDLCGYPTASSLIGVFTCNSCGYRKEEMYPHNKTSEDPQFCDRCNP